MAHGMWHMQSASMLQVVITYSGDNWQMLVTNRQCSCWDKQARLSDFLFLAECSLLQFPVSNKHYMFQQMLGACVVQVLSACWAERSLLQFAGVLCEAKQVG